MFFQTWMHVFHLRNTNDHRQERWCPFYGEEKTIGSLEIMKKIMLLFHRSETCSKICRFQNKAIWVESEKWCEISPSVENELFAFNNLWNRVIYIQCMIRNTRIAHNYLISEKSSHCLSNIFCWTVIYSFLLYFIITSSWDLNKPN